MACEGVSFTLHRTADAPGHGTWTGDGVRVWNIPMGVGLCMAWGWQMRALGMAVSPGQVALAATLPEVDENESKIKSVAFLHCRP